jgi:hypothetical protein
MAEIKFEQVPKEVRQAFQDGWAEEGPDWFAKAFARALNAWPGMFSGIAWPDLRLTIVLPLEKSDD